MIPGPGSFWRLQHAKWRKLDWISRSFFETDLAGWREKTMGNKTTGRSRNYSTPDRRLTFFTPFTEHYARSKVCFQVEYPWRYKSIRKWKTRSRPYKGTLAKKRRRRLKIRIEVSLFHLYTCQKSIKKSVDGFNQCFPFLWLWDCLDWIPLFLRKTQQTEKVLLEAGIEFIFLHFTEWVSLNSCCWLNI